MIRICLKELKFDFFRYIKREPWGIFEVLRVDEKRGIACGFDLLLVFVQRYTKHNPFTEELEKNIQFFLQYFNNILSQIQLTVTLDVLI